MRRRLVWSGASRWLAPARRCLAFGMGALAVGALAGCGASARHDRTLATSRGASARHDRAPATSRGASARHDRAPATSPIAVAQATHEYPSPSPPPQRVSGGSRSPAGAVAAFANGYINWSAGTVSADMRTLAARSVGPARAAMQLAAAETAGDYELSQGGIANSGTVEAVASLAGHPDEFVVVTRELTTATATTAYQGLQPAWHVAIATVSEVAQGEWAVSEWEPES